MKSSKKKYQMILVVNPTMKDKDRDVLLEKIEKEIEKEGVKVKAKDHMGMKGFAYEIGGFNKGDFWIFDIRGKNGIKLDELNVFLNREAAIIRYLML